MLLHKLIPRDMEALQAREVHYEIDLSPLIHPEGRPHLVRPGDSNSQGCGWWCQPMKKYPHVPNTAQIIRVFVGETKEHHNMLFNQRVTETTCVLNLPWKDGKREYIGIVSPGHIVSIYFCFGSGNIRDWRTFFFRDMVVDDITENSRLCKVHFVTPEVFKSKQQLKREHNDTCRAVERLKKARMEERKMKTRLSAELKRLRQE